MKKELNRVFYTSLLTSIVLIIIGILLLFFPHDTIKIISYILGAIIGLAGIMGLVKFFMYTDDSKYNRYGLAYGIVLLVVACFFFFKTDDIARIMPFALGIYIIISSAIKIEYTLRLKRNDNDNWKVTLIMSIVSIIFGLLLIFNPFKGALIITQVIGAIIIFYAILDIIESYIIKCNLNEIKNVILNSSVVTYEKEETKVDEEKPVENTEVKKAAKKTTKIVSKKVTDAKETKKAVKTTKPKKTVAKKATKETKKEEPTK